MSLNKSFVTNLISILFILLGYLFQNLYSNIFYSIGFFALQYYLSGLLDYTGWSNLFINIFLFVYSMIGWRLYDSSKAGFILGILTGFPLSLLYLLNSIRNSQSYLQLSTPFGLHVALVAISGPLAELALINIPHFYIYTHQDFYGICSWIPWVS